MRKRTDIPWAWFMVLFVLAAVVLWPLFHQGFYASDDGEWMAIRLSAFYQSLAEGQFPVRFLGRLNDNYGYPVANFLYPGFLYIGSLLHLLRWSYVDAIKIILGGSVIGGLLFIFVALRSRFRLIPSVLGAVGFLFSPYLTYDIWHRGSVGEVLAFFPAAVIFFALTTNTIWLLPPAIAFLIVSHNSLALIFGIGFGIMVLLRKTAARVFWPTIVGLGMATFFWFPALFERQFVLFDTTAISDPRQYFIAGEQTVLLGFPVLLAATLSVGIIKKYDKEYWSVMIPLLLGYFFALPVSRIFWDMPLVGSFIQFPYRFLSLVVLFGPWIVAAVADKVRGWHLGVFAVLCGLLWIYGVWSIEQKISFVNRPEGYYTTNEATTTVADEYMPVWVKQKASHRAVTAFEVLSGNATVTPRHIGSQSMKLLVEARETSMIQINKIYYPGWGITVDTILVPIEHENLLGVMRIIVPQGTHDVEISFRETLSRFAADLVSIGSFIVYLVYWKKLGHLS